MLTGRFGGAKSCSQGGFYGRLWSCISVREEFGIKGRKKKEGKEKTGDGKEVKKRIEDNSLKNFPMKFFVPLRKLHWE